MADTYHNIITDRQQIKDALRSINDSINGCGYSFCEDTGGSHQSIAWINSTEVADIQIILASFDFSYYHNLELVFYGILYTNIPAEAYWWDHWTKDQLELNDEWQEGLEFRFNIDDAGETQYITRAKGFSYHLGLFNYRR